MKKSEISVLTALALSFFVLSCKGPTSSETHEYVDLGLSVKWATCNIGANKPEEAGDLFAWGETETKNEYRWSSYKYCKGTSQTLTKYCTDQNFGKKDNKTVLEKEDDAAQVKWGGKWRMATMEELKELLEKCDWIATSQNGVEGYIVKSKLNGNSIFLPSLPEPGERDDENHNKSWGCGYYWFSTLWDNSPCELFFQGARDIIDYGGGMRYLGKGIRPVHP